jgi:hypothetical protein
LRKGGTIFGPRPHEYNVRVNRKTKQLARRSALAYKLRDEALRIVEDLQFEAPKTRDMARIVSDNGLTERRVLLLTAAHDDAVHRSGRNLPGVSVLPAATASTLDLLGAQTILLTEGAIEVLTEALRPAEKPAAVDVVETGKPVEAAPEKPARGRAKKAKEQAEPAPQALAEPVADEAEPVVGVAEEAPAEIAPEVAAMDEPATDDEPAGETESNEEAA